MTDKTTTLKALGSTAVLGAKLCQCRQCLRDRGEVVAITDWLAIPAEMTRMILCPKCGNKRCPHATDHRNACTGSNEPGQKGSAYENCVPPNAKVTGLAAASLPQGPCGLPGSAAGENEERNGNA